MKGGRDKTEARCCLNYAGDELGWRGEESERDRFEAGDSACSQQGKRRRLMPALRGRRGLRALPASPSVPAAGPPLQVA